MEIEKFHIARKYLFPKQLKAHGLTDKNLVLTDACMKLLVHVYTREAGVRNLERTIATLCRKTAKQIVEIRAANEALKSASAKKSKKTTKKTKGKSAVKDTGAKRRAEKVKIDAADLEELLGPPRYTHGKIEEKNEIGLTNGLAYTDAGGDILQIEVSVVPGKGQVKVTGKLGEVMQESAMAAMSYVRSRAEALGLSKDFYQHLDIHLHVPEGAVPKDGPSAGITMATAITSALIKVPVKRNVAMTGEITLRGRVLPIGGLKEKLLAAKIAGIKKVLYPKENTPDLKKIPDAIKKGIELIPVETADQVMRLALDLKDPESFLADGAEEILVIASAQANRKSTRKGRSVKH